MFMPLLLALLLNAGATSAQAPPTVCPLDQGDISALVRLSASNRLVNAKRLAQIVNQDGIDFAPTEAYLDELQKDGAKKVLLDALRSVRQPRPAKWDTRNGNLVVYATGGDPGQLVRYFTPQPPYSEKARRARVSGSLLLWVVIGPSGKVVDIKEVSQMLGEGLDESAIRTVATWEFKPPTRDGVPVFIHTQVEISFRLW